MDLGISLFEGNNMNGRGRVKPGDMIVFKPHKTCTCGFWKEGLINQEGKLTMFDGERMLLPDVSNVLVLGVVKSISRALTALYVITDRQELLWAWEHAVLDSKLGKGKVMKC